MTPTGQPTLKRRPMLNQPGEMLLLTSDPAAYIRRFDQFVAASGIAPERVLALPLVATPIPVPRQSPDGGVDRWTEANAAFMWHPLMWLPKQLALRYRYRTIEPDDGGTGVDTEVEPDDVWAIRVVTALAGSGLYDHATGTWLDVLAYFGLDLEDPIDFARVERWLAGDADVLLDAIDLTELVDFGATPEDSVQIASDFAAALSPAQWSITSGELAKLIMDADEFSLRSAIVTWCEVASQALRDVPNDGETGEDYGESFAVLAEAALDQSTDLPLIRDSALDALSQIAQDYRPALDAVAMAM